MAFFQKIFRMRAALGIHGSVFMHPSSSKFYQKIVFLPFHLIFSGLAPCFCFLKLFQAVKFLNEICFFSANSTIRLLISGYFYV
jgi:hypothetical protein